MKRIVLYLVALGAILFIVKATAPLIILGVVGLVLMAWKRPATVGRLAARAQLARLPAWMRATCSPDRGPYRSFPAACHATYAGACLTPGIGDYDCAGGAGNGPNYIAGPIHVAGHDEHELDREGDGLACEG